MSRGFGLYAEARRGLGKRMGGFATARPSTASSPRSARRTRDSGAGGANSRHTASAVAGMNGWERTASRATVRSEEHTSELQSQFHLVCRLLLEKKKETG